MEQKKNHKKVLITVLIIFIILICIGLIRSTVRALSGGSFISPDTTSSSSNTLDASSKTETKDSKTTDNDMDIILKSGHPTLFGSVKASHKVWDNTGDDKILFADSGSSYSDQNIISMDALSTSDVINEIEIYFSNSNNIGSVSLDEALHVTAEYIPFEILKKYYEFNMSEILVPKKDNKNNEGTYYIISYKMIDKYQYTDETSDYGGSIVAIININTKGSNTQHIQLTTSIPNWMNIYPDQNGYKEQSWKCDLYDYRNK
ncbi:MAG: hypothetical protein PUF90_07040 [Lachnospiraceae bacterium]|nr:hypothetical protein [Lachnospiraceae bacterium]